VLIEAAYQEYSDGMVRAMTGFSGDEQAARDAVSHAFTKALMNRSLLENMPESAMKAWLYAAARNSVVDMKRREKHLVSFTEDFAQENQTDLTDHVAVASLLDRLPPELRKPIHMKYFERMNASEIGQTMNLIPGTVRTRVRKAISLMRVIMQGDENDQ
jgi:RNA polymerase sigma-70 factor (ECF subfamily)